MISGLYSAATAMDAAAIRHEASAENLAHAHMPGFRRRVVYQSAFSTLLTDRKARSGFSQQLGATSGSSSAPQIAIDFTRGNLKATDRSLDLALDGDGFFVVDGPDGPLYTRNGSFQASPEGRLVTVDGLSVNGRNGPVDIPANTTSEAIRVTRDGRLLADGVEFGQLETVRFENLSALISVGASLFQAPDGVDAEESEEFILQGFVETSNVAHMDELVNIMIASRQYEAAQKAINTIEEALERHISGN